MKVTSITDGNGADDGAFCPKKMAEAGVDNLWLSHAISEILSPFAGLLKDGHGFGVYVRGEDGTVIGFTAPQERPE